MSGGGTEAAVPASGQAPTTAATPGGVGDGRRISQAYCGPGEGGSRRSPSPSSGNLPTLQYLLIITVQNIRVQVNGEDAEQCLQVSRARCQPSQHRAGAACLPVCVWCAVILVCLPLEAVVGPRLIHAELICVGNC